MNGYYENKEQYQTTPRRNRVAPKMRDSFPAMDNNRLVVYERTKKLFREKKKRQKQILVRTSVALALSAVIVMGARHGYNAITGRDVLYYSVEPGDTLASICNEYSTPMDTVMRDNGIRDANLIQVDEVLAFITSVDKVEEYASEHDMEHNKQVYYGREVKSEGRSK